MPAWLLVECAYVMCYPSRFRGRSWRRRGLVVYLGYVVIRGGLSMLSSVLSSEELTYLAGLLLRERDSYSAILLNWEIQPPESQSEYEFYQQDLSNYNTICALIERLFPSLVAQGAQN